jgi:cytochrome c-type biogenesis protein CcmH/NrfG
MKTESIAFGVAGVFFGLILGWIVGSQQASPVPSASSQSQTASSASASAAAAPSAPAFDASQAAALEQQAAANPKDATVRATLGNMYFDASKYDDATKWYEQAFQLNPHDADVSTDLGVSYYYTNQTDRALAQFDKSLQIDPKHLKTLLNLGIVRWFGKHDQAGAVQAWERVVALAPTSEEARRAQQGLDGLKSAGRSAGSGAGGE